jgi:arginyl-tRNA synthetase
MRAVGYTVVADNHLGDWGTQFGKLIVAWRRYLDEAAYARG